MGLDQTALRVGCLQQLLVPKEHCLPYDLQTATAGGDVRAGDGVSAGVIVWDTLSQ